MVLRVLRQADWNHRTTQNGGPNVVEVLQRLLQTGPIVDPGRHHHLGVELDAVRGELAQLGNDSGAVGFRRTYRRTTGSVACTET